MGKVSRQKSRAKIVLRQTGISKSSATKAKLASVLSSKDQSTKKLVHQPRKIDKRKQKKAFLLQKETLIKKKTVKARNILTDVSDMLSSIKDVEQDQTVEESSREEILRRINFPVRMGKSGVTKKTRKAVESSDLEKFQNALQNTGFKQNPFAVLQQHLSTVAAIERDTM